MNANITMPCLQSHVIDEVLQEMKHAVPEAVTGAHHHSNVHAEVLRVLVVHPAANKKSSKIEGE